MVTDYPELTQLKEQLRFGNKAEIPINQLSSSELGFLQNLYRQAGPEMSTQAAMIRYHPPGRKDRIKIWQVMTEQFGLPIKAGLTSDLADIFPKATGREIKGLTKLAAKYCLQKKVPPSLAIFKRCSVFRGMDIELKNECTI